jgi:hypothetical protein
VVRCGARRDGRWVVGRGGGEECQPSQGIAVANRLSFVFISRNEISVRD